MNVAIYRRWNPGNHLDLPKVAYLPDLFSGGATLEEQFCHKIALESTKLIACAGNWRALPLSPFACFCLGPTPGSGCAPLRSLEVRVALRFPACPTDVILAVAVEFLGFARLEVVPLAPLSPSAVTL